MILLGCIEFHLKGCARWIIVMGLRVLLIISLSNPKNISGGGIMCTCNRYKNKKFIDPDIIRCIFYKKCSWRNTCVGLRIKNHMFFTRPC
jgi:hypothetical protein